ncbi:MAG: YceI family protein [Acidimicrobiales bacterium]|nr:YceI family protein [Acidimicrobiales bacterium]
MARKLLLTLAVVVLAVIGAGVYWFVIRDDSVEKKTTDCDPEPCEVTLDSVDGTWSVVPAESEGTLVITEEIGSVLDHQAEGRTGDITGTLEVDGDTVTAADLAIDLTGLEFVDQPGGGFDVANRANAMGNTGLQTSQFPEATFTLTEPLVLDGDLTEGDTATADATGDLTLHGVTRSITFPVEATADGEQVRVSPADFIPIVLADHDITVQTPPMVARVADEGGFDFLLVLERAA